MDVIEVEIERSFIRGRDGDVMGAYLSRIQTKYQFGGSFKTKVVQMKGRSLSGNVISREKESFLKKPCLAGRVDKSTEQDLNFNRGQYNERIAQTRLRVAI